MLVQVLAQRLPGRLLSQGLGPEQLIEGGIAGSRWSQGDDLDAVKPLADLVGRRVVALDDGRQLLAEQLQVQLAGAVADPLGVDLFGDRFYHPLVVLLLQVHRQAPFGRLGTLAAVHLVPGDFERQPLLRPVAGEPRDEIAFGASLHLVFPDPHRTPCIVICRAGSGHRGFDQFWSIRCHRAGVMVTGGGGAGALDRAPGEGQQ